MVSWGVGDLCLVQRWPDRFTRRYPICFFLQFLTYYTSGSTEYYLGAQIEPASAFMLALSLNDTCERLSDLSERVSGSRDRVSAWLSVVLSKLFFLSDWTGWVTSACTSILQYKSHLLFHKIIGTYRLQVAILAKVLGPMVRSMGTEWHNEKNWLGISQITDSDLYQFKCFHVAKGLG